MLPGGPLAPLDDDGEKNEKEAGHISPHKSPLSRGSAGLFFSLSGTVAQGKSTVSHNDGIRLPEGLQIEM